MKLRKIYIAISILLTIGCQTSCNYLDVIPPAQADFSDTMKDQERVESFLYTCYSYIPDSHPFEYTSIENSADEFVEPLSWNIWPQQVSWGILTPNCMNSGWGGSQLNIWKPSYDYIGYVHRFLDLIDKYDPIGVTEDDKLQYKAECWFLEAYYHFRVLAAFGPCPIINEMVDPNISKEDIPGRSHFDYCVDYIVKKLDDAASVLPPVRPEAELGRATSVICKALKARVLLYAASDLWNGKFPFPNWKNENYETEGYGKELVSHTYDPKKWERARIACEEALTEATKEGRYELFDIATANSKAERDGLGLPFVPGKNPENPDDVEFLQRVRMFQYLSTAHEGDGNKEIIWGQRINQDYINNGWGYAFVSKLPLRTVKRTNGQYTGGWCGYGPTLYAVQHFYTEKGKLPENDNTFFYPQQEWYERFYEGAQSPELATDRLDDENVKNDVIKLNSKREARFYAWIVFDGGQYGQMVNDGQPLWINLKNKNTNGYKSGERNYSGSGYLSRKFIDPKLTFRASDGGCVYNPNRRPFIRLAELYLNLAECYAAENNVEGALDNLNVIRRRAGFSDLTEADLTDMSLMDWVRNERFVELYEEGHRYYDVRRWCIAPEVLDADSRWGLNAFNENPSFEDFNTPVKIDQPFKWDDRLYLLPIWSGDEQDELYSNPQMVQAPGY